MKAEVEVRQALRAWVLKVNDTLDPSQLTDQTPLIEKRLITSVQILELILLIERLREERFELKTLKPGAFHSVDTIYERFFRKSAA